ncbi:hypothetical protein GGS23DRAFT_580547 [Durotheca rogersii]|uniref:uncharacterized protein n=1 Tax=Durotheca rogersii TaxID=419775 RepID=UPI00221FC80E|nr:uncharacterized protein GGS23DRAFT_580547 [Durotheca rogersii]KAI5860542.1 hypothetical protein GGS23DRAFT_580547 [Durotheca rogersii]
MWLSGSSRKGRGGSEEEGRASRGGSVETILAVPSRMFLSFIPSHNLPYTMLLLLFLSFSLPIPLSLSPPLPSPRYHPPLLPRLPSTSSPFVPSVSVSLAVPPRRPAVYRQVCVDAYVLCTDGCAYVDACGALCAMGCAYITQARLTGWNRANTTARDAHQHIGKIGGGGGEGRKREREREGVGGQGSSPHESEANPLQGEVAFWIAVEDRNLGYAYYISQMAVADGRHFAIHTYILYGQTLDSQMLTMGWLCL